MIVIFHADYLIMASLIPVKVVECVKKLDKVRNAKNTLAITRAKAHKHLGMTKVFFRGSMMCDDSALFHKKDVE